MNYEQAIRMLPHHPPLRLLDEVAAYIPGQLMVGRLFPARLQQLCGGAVVIPPALIWEGLAQTCVLLTQLETEPLQPGEIPMLGNIRGTIGRPVEWQETLTFHVEPIRLLSKSALLHGELRLGDGSVAATARLAVAITKAGVL